MAKEKTAKLKNIMMGVLIIQIIILPLATAQGIETSVSSVKTDEKAVTGSFSRITPINAAAPLFSHAKSEKISLLTPTNVDIPIQGRVTYENSAYTGTVEVCVESTCNPSVQVNNGTFYANVQDVPIEDPHSPYRLTITVEGNTVVDKTFYPAGAPQGDLTVNGNLDVTGAGITIGDSDTDNPGSLSYFDDDFYGYTPSGWQSLTSGGNSAGNGSSSSLWVDQGSYIYPSIFDNLVVTNSRVGIGIPSPLAPLHVIGPAIFEGHTDQPGENGSLVYDTDVNFYKFFNGTEWVSVPTGTISYNGTIWQQDGNNIYYTAGYVGIGTTTPLVGLDVEVISGGAATIGSSNNAATGDFAIAMGDGTNAIGDYSITMGSNTTAEGIASAAIGYNSNASGDYSTASGYNTTAIGESSTVMGFNTTAQGQDSVAMGDSTTASGESSTAMGENTVAQGDNSVAMGKDITVTQPDTLGVGGDIYATGKIDAGVDVCIPGKCLSNVTGGSGGADTDWVDDGTNIYRASGNVGIGTATPNATLDVNGSGKFGSTYQAILGEEGNGDDIVGSAGYFSDGTRNVYLAYGGGTAGYFSNSIYSVSLADNNGGISIYGDIPGKQRIVTLSSEGQTGYFWDGVNMVKLSDDNESGYFANNPFAPDHNEVVLASNDYAIQAKGDSYLDGNLTSTGDVCTTQGNCLNNITAGEGGNVSFNQSLTDGIYVPYTGANKDVDLGIYNINSTGKARFGSANWAEIGADTEKYAGYFFGPNNAETALGYNDGANDWAIRTWGNSYLDGNMTATGDINASGDICTSLGNCLNNITVGESGNSSFNQTLTDGIYVPYTEANQNVDLGVHNLTAKSISLSGNQLTLDTDNTGAAYIGIGNDTNTILIEENAVGISGTLYAQTGPYFGSLGSEADSTAGAFSSPGTNVMLSYNDYNNDSWAVHAFGNSFFNGNVYVTGNVTAGQGITLGNEYRTTWPTGMTYAAGDGISITGDTISASDASATNEIQTLSINGNDLSISGTGGNTVTLPSAADGNNYTTQISVTGDGTKTITLSREGMEDLNASFSESDPLWTANQSSYYNITEIQNNYYNRTEIDGLAAQAPTFAGMTAASYNGLITFSSLTGYQAANAICNSTYPESHMCTQNEILMIIALTGSSPASGNAWIQKGSPGYTADANDCVGWTSSSNQDLAAYWRFSDNYGIMINCQTALPLACCR